jgi:hypothetical protein
MTLSDLASIGSLVSGMAVLFSLIFVGFQLRQNTMQMKRAELNSSMEQASAFRLTIIGDPDVAELWVKGLSDTDTLNGTDAVRFELLLEEALWMMFMIWDRSKGGLLDKDEWTRSCSGLLADILAPRHGAIWWENYKIKFPDAFVRDLDAVIGTQRSPTANV